jgi:chemotaxis protein methyltransferase CheR
VLMRNVLIYFDTESRGQVLRNVRARMRPGGVLLLGTAETTVQLDPAWSVVRYDKTSTFTVNPTEARP